MGRSNEWLCLPLLPRLLEISQVRRRLVFLGGHQVAVRAEEIVLVPDRDVMVVLGTVVLVPDRIVVATIFLGDGPGAGQRIVDRRDLVQQQVAIGAIEDEALLDDRLVVLVQRYAARLERARSLHAAGFDLERVVAAIPIVIDPFSDRVA